MSKCRTTSRKSVLVCNIYRPPQGDVETFIHSFELALQKIDLAKKDLVMLGDFNIDFLEKSGKNTKNVNRPISKFGFIKLINGPTSFGTWTNSCIHQIITNSHHVLKAGVANVNISDHQLFFFVKKKKKDIPTKSNFQGRSYRNYDPRKLYELLNNQNCEVFFSK